MLILAFITVSLAYLFNLANVDLVRDNLIFAFCIFQFFVTGFCWWMPSIDLG